jgi:alpha,alpha-trehalase
MNFAVCIGRGLLTAALTVALLPAAQGQSQPAAQRQAQPSTTTPQPPQVLFKNLFVAVQSAKLFPDSKTFADAVPKSSPTEILSRFDAAKPASHEALQAFVAENFVLPAQVSGPESPAAEHVSITRHIDLLWDQLTRTTTSAPPYSSLLALPEPYVVPGGRFRELYYWDSYFTMLGLVESGRQDLVEHMVRDFASLIDTYGHVPNGTRSYYLSRSQPPFFYAMVGLLSSEDPAAS